MPNSELKKKRLTRKDASKPNYNKLARNPELWNKEARRIITNLSNSPYAAPKVEPKLYNYEEVKVWL